jgi:predicted DsbA family dithiol-disulfide isomerase
VRIEIWSDVVCPWCYIGKRRFERALSAFDARDDVEVVYRSFELDPHAPAERADLLTGHLAGKYGVDLTQAQAMQDRVTSLAAVEGLTYRLDLARTARTFDAHRVLHLARKQGVQPAMKERLLRGYFSEGAWVADPDVLVRLAVDVGLLEVDVRDVLSSDAHGAEVRADEQEAAALGIQGVPFFVVDRRLAVSGAQPTEVFTQLLEQGWSRRQVA